MIKLDDTPKQDQEETGLNADMSGDCGCFLCSICGIYIEFKAYSATEELHFDIKFCPNCGAKMNGEDSGKNA